MSTLSFDALVQPLCSLGVGVRGQAELLILLMNALADRDPVVTLDGHSVEQWKLVARQLDVALNMLEGEAGAGTAVWIRVFAPDLLERFEELREPSRERFRALLERIEDEILLGPMADAAAAAAVGQPTTAHEDVRRELGLDKPDDVEDAA